jgi:hypothetical protein
VGGAVISEGPPGEGAGRAADPSVDRGLVVGRAGGADNGPEEAELGRAIGAIATLGFVRVPSSSVKIGRFSKRSNSLAWLS